MQGVVSWIVAGPVGLVSSDRAKLAIERSNCTNRKVGCVTVSFAKRVSIECIDLDGSELGKIAVTHHYELLEVCDDI